MECPTLIQIESSTACDAKCIFCPHVKLKRPSGSMSDGLFEKILLQANELRISEILLFLNGEPLIFPRLFDWLQALREYGLKTTIFTNGNSLTEAKSLKLISYNDVVQTIVFSLGGVDKETYNEIMRLDYDRVRTNVERFLQLNHEKIKTVAHIPYFSKSAPFQESWHRVWGKIETKAFTSLFNFAGLLTDDLELKEDESHHCSYCERLDNLAILWDGRVCLCCMDAEGEIILGDANKEPLIEIFNSEMASYYREMHNKRLWDKLKLCKDCNMNIIGIEK